MKEYLDSDRVNFLIWRYLLEGNYRETAAKFQKEWHIQEPHRHFSFAPHVKNHALVSLLNRGLLYNSLERDYLQSQQPPQQAPRDAAATAEARPLGVFGPLITQPAEAAAAAAAVASAPRSSSAGSSTGAAAAARHHHKQENGGVDDDHHHHPHQQHADAGADEHDSSRKRQMLHGHHQPNGSPAKKQRLSNGFESAGAGAGAGAGGGGGADGATTTPMEIDHQAENNHAYPSPLEGESAPTPVPRTDGPEQGTQIDKVDELAQDSIFLRLVPDNNNAATNATNSTTATATATSSSSVAGTAPSPSSISSSDQPIVLHCEWHPKDPSILAAAGTDALARVWTISRATPPESTQPDHVNGVNRPYKDLSDEDIPRSSTVTAMAWNWDGSALALAAESGSKARISIWAPDGTALHHFDVQEPPVIKLRWNPNNASILGIAPDNSGTLVTVFSATNPNPLSYAFPNHDLTADPLDAAWISESEFFLCGGDLLVSLRCTDDAITLNRQFETRGDDSFGQVQFDWRSKLVATASEKGMIDLWDEHGQRRSISAHIGLITSLMWQPLQTNPADDERLLASGGEDGAISIWNARQPESKPKCSMTMELPVVALAFTPDGAFIAGATMDRILIWKVGEHSIPRASWSRSPHPGWLSPKMNGETEEEDTHCLCWDASGQKLAYGANSRLAVINFR